MPPKAYPKLSYIYNWYSYIKSYLSARVATNENFIWYCKIKILLLQNNK